MYKKWLRIFSPCVIALVLIAAFSIWGIANSHRSQGWSMLAVFAFLPFGAFYLIADVILKFLFKIGTGVLWLAETGLIILSVLFFQFYFK